MLIATPDHWHSPMTIEALAAGKDVYCEKPVSNEIEPAVKMLEAVRKSNRIVQIGTQQRSWHHFQEAAKLFHEGYIGTSVNHCQMCPPGGGGGGGGAAAAAADAAADPPTGFNWEMFQGPAKRKPFVPGRRNWRGWYDYGGGNLTDWGVHLTDIMNWYMKTDGKAPLLTSASAQYVRHPARSRARARHLRRHLAVRELRRDAVERDGARSSRTRAICYGNYFFGDRGVLLVNRIGYEVRPYPPAQGRGGGRGQAPNAPPPPPAPPIEAKKFKDPSGNMSEVADSSFGSATHRHVRNFLDCVKSRQQPVCNVEVGFYSTLPTPARHRRRSRKAGR